MKFIFNLLAFLLLASIVDLHAVDYPHITDEPQKNGWPLTAAERAYVVDKPEHEAHVKTVQAHQGPIDVLLVGDSITIQWGDSWTKHFPTLKAVNIGIGGDKTQNLLWRLDVAKILPAHEPGHRFYEVIKKTNAALDSLKLDSDPKVRVLDLSNDFLNSDGTLKKQLFTPDNIHLSTAGYTVYAERLKPILTGLGLAQSTKEHRQYLLLNYSTSLQSPKQTHDMMKGRPEIERAMLDAMKQAPD